MKTNRWGNGGMSFIEMVLAMFIFSVVSMATFPMVEHSVQRTKEVELRQALRTMRRAIDRYYAQREREDPSSVETARYPATLHELVKGRYMRSLPVDPMTGRRQWLTLSTSDVFDGKPEQFSTDGKNVFDVRSLSCEKSRQGRPYVGW